MAELSSLTRAKPTEATIDLGDGDSVTLSFDANKVTPHWMGECMDRLNAREITAMADALAAVILTWDVTNEGEPYPPTGKNIAVLSFGAINRLYERVCEAASPSDAEGNASPPSSAVPPSATSEQVSPSSPNGSDTSPSPSASVSQPVT